MGDAEDCVVLADPDFIPVLQQVADQVPTLRHIVVLGDDTADATGDDAVAYEPLIAAASHEHDALDLDERSPAGLCYTLEPRASPRAWRTRIVRYSCTPSA